MNKFKTLLLTFSLPKFLLEIIKLTSILSFLAFIGYIKFSLLPAVCIGIILAKVINTNLSNPKES